MRLPFMSWPVKYLPTFHSNKRKWPAIALTLQTASRETFHQVIVVAVLIHNTVSAIVKTLSSVHTSRTSVTI